MNHLDLLKTPAFMDWNSQLARSDDSGGLKCALAHLRNFFRGVAMAFPDRTIPEGMIRAYLAGDDPRGNWTAEELESFSIAVNRLSREHGLPAPFELPPLTTEQVAGRLGVGIRRAQQLVSGHPEAVQERGEWLLPVEQFEALTRRPDGRGRPRRRESRDGR